MCWICHCRWSTSLPLLTVVIYASQRSRLWLHTQRSHFNFVVFMYNAEHRPVKRVQIHWVSAVVSEVLRPPWFQIGLVLLFTALFTFFLIYAKKKIHWFQIVATLSWESVIIGCNTQEYLILNYDTLTPQTSEVQTYCSTGSEKFDPVV